MWWRPWHCRTHEDQTTWRRQVGNRLATAGLLDQASQEISRQSLAPDKRLLIEKRLAVSAIDKCYGNGCNMNTGFYCGELNLGSDSIARKQQNSHRVSLLLMDRRVLG